MEVDEIRFNCPYPMSILIQHSLYLITAEVENMRKSKNCAVVKCLFFTLGRKNPRMAVSLFIMKSMVRVEIKGRIADRKVEGFIGLSGVDFQLEVSMPERQLALRYSGGRERENEIER